MLKLRLDRIIANSGLYTRSQAVFLIKAGRVSVDGDVAVSASLKYDPRTSFVCVDGKNLGYKEFRYIIMNKPRGYISSTSDKRDRTVIELLDESYSKLGLFPAGRLDKDSEGLLILTNDGDFAYEITSPSKKVNKRYFVQIDGTVTDKEIKALSEGLTLKDGTKCLPALLEAAPDGAYVTLHEGKYHQVKRMMSALQMPVKYLKRISIGDLALDESLKPGEYYEVADDIRSLIFHK